MSLSYRYWNGFGYDTKFDVEDEENPKVWALRKQSEGFDMEVGTMAWDENEVCSWLWEKKIIKPIKRSGGMRRIPYSLAKKFLDLKKDNTLREIAAKVEMTYEDLYILQSKLNLNSYKDYIEMYELGVTEYHHNYIERITEDIFNQIYDKHEEGLSQTNIGKMLNISRRTVCDVVNLTCQKYKVFKERRDENSII